MCACVRACLCVCVCVCVHMGGWRYLGHPDEVRYDSGPLGRGGLAEHHELDPLGHAVEEGDEALQHGVVHGAAVHHKAVVVLELQGGERETWGRMGRGVGRERHRERHGERHSMRRLGVRQRRAERGGRERYGEGQRARLRET